jgi:long-chain acyl-CoA synthetase
MALASVKGRRPEEIHGEMSLVGDLGFDSLALTELLVALEAKYGAIEPAALQGCQTVFDVERLVAHRLDAKKSDTRPKIEGRDRASVSDVVMLPREVQDKGKEVIGKIQDFFYGGMMSSKVLGRAFIPHNRSTIVVANHGSHLDMGFVRHALGTYGEDIVTLAAQDYFFDKGSLKRAFFENFTNLKAFDRKGGLRASERQAAEILESGRTMLIFPEGTRSPDGEIHEFKSLLGHLALRYEVDILPVYVAGTRDAMPKGAKLPKSRTLTARIGPPITVRDMQRLTRELSMGDASREIAKLARRAVVALRDGGLLDASKLETLDDASKPQSEHPLITLFEELEEKFKPGRVDKPVSFYFTLGGDALSKWTVKVDGEQCEIKNGKPESGTADCVLKTTPEIFSKIVRDSWVPGPAEFLSGQVKSNDVELLLTFQKIFELS